MMQCKLHSPSHASNKRNAQKNANYVHLSTFLTWKAKPSTYIVCNTSHLYMQDRSKKEMHATLIVMQKYHITIPR